MVVSNNGTVLAFCEGRKKGQSDSGDIDLVLKRSFDNGEIWQSMQLVWDDGENTCGNPCPVVDRGNQYNMALINPVTSAPIMNVKYGTAPQKAPAPCGL